MTKKKKISIWIVIVLIILVGIGFVLGEKQDKVEYETEIAERKDVVQTVSVTGTVQAVERSDLAFESGGTIKEILVDVGDEVRKGDKIAWIDSRVLYSQKNEALKALALAQEQETLMRRTWKDYKPEEREQQKIKVEQAQAAVNTVNQQLSKTVLYASMDGIIARRNVDLEEVTMAGATVATIIKPGQLEIEADVPESDIALIKLRQNAEAELDAIDDESFKTKVIKIDPSSTEISDVVYYKITLKFEADDDRFMDGMSIDIDVLTAEKKNVIATPSRAVKKEGEKKYVEILEGEEQVRRSFVETGLKGDDGKIEIKSGVREGEQVIVLTSEIGK